MQLKNNSFGTYGFLFTFILLLVSCAGMRESVILAQLPANFTITFANLHQYDTNAPSRLETARLGIKSIERRDSVYYFDMFSISNIQTYQHEDFDVQGNRTYSELKRLISPMNGLYGTYSYRDSFDDTLMIGRDIFVHKPSGTEEFARENKYRYNDAGNLLEEVSLAKGNSVPKGTRKYNKTMNELTQILLPEFSKVFEMDDTTASICRFYYNDANKDALFSLSVDMDENQIIVLSFIKGNIVFEELISPERRERIISKYSDGHVAERITYKPEISDSTVYCMMDGKLEIAGKRGEPKEKMIEWWVAEWEFWLNDLASKAPRVTNSKIDNLANVDLLGSVVSKEIFTYNSDGDISSMEKINEEGTIILTLQYAYNDEGLISKFQALGPYSSVSDFNTGDGEFYRKPCEMSFQYDESGQLKSRVVTRDFTDIREKNIDEYLYDYYENGLNKQVLLKKNGKLYKKAVWTYEYF